MFWAPWTELQGTAVTMFAFVPNVRAAFLSPLQGIRLFSDVFRIFFVKTKEELDVDTISSLQETSARLLGRSWGAILEDASPTLARLLLTLTQRDWQLSRHHVVSEDIFQREIQTFRLLFWCCSQPPFTRQCQIFLHLLIWTQKQRSQIHLEPDMRLNMKHYADTLQREKKKHFSH